MSVSPQVQLVLEWGKGFQTGDLNLLAKCLHRDYRHITYPQSINQQPQTKDVFIGHLGQIVPHWTESKSTTHSITEAPGKVIVHFTNETKTKSGANAPYESIIIATIVTDDDGTLKIKQIEEFVDSQTHADRVKAFAAARTE